MMWPMWQLSKMDRKKGSSAEGTFLFQVPGAESHGGAGGVVRASAGGWASEADSVSAVPCAGCSPGSHGGDG